MKVNQKQALLSKANDVIKESQKAQTDYKNGIKSKLTRQAKNIAQDELDEDELEDITNDPNVIYQVILEIH